MNAAWIYSSLERYPAALDALLKELHEEDAAWKPDEKAWSLREIAGHLCDEETDDFRMRLRLTLAQEGPWPPIDPVRTVLERRHNETPLSKHLEQFAQLRIESMEWLRSLHSPDWEAVYEHPKIGPIRAGDLLAAWCAHDQLHLKQISQRLHQLTVEQAGDYSTKYAG